MCIRDSLKDLGLGSQWRLRKQAMWRSSAPTAAGLMAHYGGNSDMTNMANGCLKMRLWRLVKAE
eukprot:12081543-Karenia_brevis.AAC.1